MNSKRISNSSFYFSLPSLLSILALLAITSHVAAAPPAFPGAEGYGAGTIGGRGGEIVYVDNLNDKGPGSLRAALDLDRPRTVVFSVGGTITLQSPIVVDSPFLTIAGQSAPGGGITLRMADSANGPAINIATHDVVVRFIRVRRGIPDTIGCCDDSISISSAKEKVYNVILDHCSISWAVDELFDIWYEVENVTIQWSILSEALADLSSRTPWGKGPIFGDRVKNISVHHNLFANNIQRNPAINLYAESDGIFEITNNIIYNWAHSAITIQSSTSDAKFKVNLVGNVFIPGPNYTDNRYEIVVPEGSISKSSVFVKDNIGPHRQETEDEWSIVGIPSDGKTYMKVQAPEASRKNEKWSISNYPILEIPSQNLSDKILSKVGAVFPYRDSVDSRILDQIKSNKGQIIAHPKDVGGWPSLPKGEPLLDTDRDGMPDSWEQKHGTNPELNDAALDKNGDGYTNIENYLNSLVESYYINISQPRGLRFSSIGQ